MLEFRNVSVSVGHTPLLENISVSFPKGEISVIVGPNGCGKTTLLQCLNGISHVNAGSIFLDDRDYLSLSPKERAVRLSFLPQVRTIIPALPVKTLVEHGRFPHLGFSRKKSPKDIELVHWAMKFTDTDSFSDQYVNTLSGGIRQRVFFAMVLAQDCDYIVLDEPTTYLDLSAQRQFYNMIRLLKEQNRTVIMVLHDLAQAVRIADQLILMNERQIITAGTPEECLRQHVIETVFHTSWKRFTDGDGEYYFFE